MEALLTLVEQYGLWLVFANVLALQCGLPVPAYPTLIVVGALTARGDITIAQVMAVALGWFFRDAVNEVLAVLAQAGRWGLLALLVALALFITVKALQRYQLIRSLRMSRVSVDELNDLLAHEAPPLIVDVRSLSSQKSGRIPGAVWIDSHAFDESLRSRGLDARMGQDVVVYCDCPNEASAATVAKKLMRVGFKRVRPLRGGIDAWIEKGYAVETS
jgi:rhodanese-related sulfurtransferase